VAILVFIGAAQLDPILVLLGIGVSFFDLDSVKRDLFRLSIFLLGITQSLLVALEGEIPFDNLLG